MFKYTVILSIPVVFAGAILIPNNAFAARQKACLKEDGSVVIKRRCRAKKGEAVLNLSDISATLQGPKGEKGDQGEDGPLVSTLPSGVTLRGDFFATETALGANQLAASSQSFGFEFVEAPQAHYMFQGMDATTECPGTPDLPEAAPGHLCVYEKTSFAPGDTGITSGLENSPGPGTRVASKYGFTVYARSQVAGTFFVRGSWAATAP